MDTPIRLATFEWLEHQVGIHGEVLPREILARGFTHAGQRVPLVGPQGIFKPAVCPEIPLSITTTVKGPYTDHFGPEGLLRYFYRGRDPQRVVQNGLALCKLHHAAFDQLFLAIRPDYLIEIRRDIMEEEDGPMLLHGLKEMHLQPLHKPLRRASWPDPARLEERYERFREFSPGA